MSDAGDKAGKRNLPSWMGSRDSGNKLRRNKPYEDEGEKHEQSGATHHNETKSHRQSASKSKAGPGKDTLSFTTLLDGVVFVLSGFVNPERSTLRSQAQEMGAEYQPDWNSNCTLLICAFPNTPKFRQVEADCGTIVSKECISECYSQKKLVAIEPYLMHAGKPWRKSCTSHEASLDDEPTPPKKQHRQVERSLPPNPSITASKGGTPTRVKECIRPAEVKKWAIIDLSETISWLDSQEERPEPSEVKKIASEGILTCLQDAVESLEKNQGIRQATEQWSFIPRVVKELEKLEDLRSSKRSVTEKDIYEQALTCKRIYEKEFSSLDDNDSVKKKPEPGKGHKDKTNTDSDIKSSDAVYDSDETIEMTEDEIDLAYKSISSKLSK